eukprot:GHVT01078578.1.p1 GENE.GHVT01078578.1~~GHVT01078578.1.p1  ORF type:complete len:143 (+),score=27.87 GHVT01078578.1:333-761(+)
MAIAPPMLQRAAMASSTRSRRSSGASEENEWHPDAQWKGDPAMSNPTGPTSDGPKPGMSPAYAALLGLSSVMFVLVFVLYPKRPDSSSVAVSMRALHILSFGLLLGGQAVAFAHEFLVKRQAPKQVQQMAIVIQKQRADKNK